jgi:hypothetical protein
MWVQLKIHRKRRTAMRNLRLTAGLILAACLSAGAAAEKNSNYVPDAATAERIAEAVLTARYGQERVGAQQPFVATAYKGYWIVEGSLKQKPGEHRPGGGFGVWVNKRSGCIANMVEQMK